ncbi:MAG: hypothetical protein ACYS47_06720 [Planctomycetota bacterium]|jgi:hypothetical protein
MSRAWQFILVLLLALFAANHIEYFLHVRSAGKAEPPASGVPIPVKTEEGEDGHFQVAVDEAKLRPPGEDPVFRFSELRKWHRDPEGKTPPPKALADLLGRRVAAAGFMIAEGDPEDVARFALVPAIHPAAHDHDHGGKPGGDVGRGPSLLVEAEKPVVFEHRKPVLVRGRLSRREGEGGALLHLAADAVEPAASRGLSGGSLPSGDELPDFDFFWLEEIEYQEARGRSPELPDGLAALEGKKVRAEGFVQDRDEGPPRTFVLAREFWDGCCQGTPPTYANSVLIVPAEEQPIPPPWVERAAFTGVLKVCTKPGEWNRMWIVRLEGAREVLLERPWKGPRFPLWTEALALLIVLVFGMWRKQGAPSGESGETPAADAGESAGPRGGAAEDVGDPSRRPEEATPQGSDEEAPTE